MNQTDQNKKDPAVQAEQQEEKSGFALEIANPERAQATQEYVDLLVRAYREEKKLDNLTHG
jgi:hypothetical protein